MVPLPTLRRPRAAFTDTRESGSFRFPLLQTHHTFLTPAVAQTQPAHESGGLGWGGGGFVRAAGGHVQRGEEGRQLLTEQEVPRLWTGGDSCTHQQKH